MRENGEAWSPPDTRLQLTWVQRLLAPLVEPLSIDEAFLDLTGTEALHRTNLAGTLAGLARRVEEELGITVLIGLSYHKFQAKIASDLDEAARIQRDMRRIAVGCDLRQSGEMRASCGHRHAVKACVVAS